MLDQTQKDVLFHLGYEWWMFRAGCDLLAGISELDDPVRNALVESLAIHGRGLVHFFYMSKKSATDWNVTDLGSRFMLEAEPAVLRHWRQDTNRRVAHLTRTRSNPLHEWDAATAREVFANNIGEVRRLLVPDVPIDWIGDRPSASELLATGATLQPTSPTGAIGPTGPGRPEADRL